MTVRGRERSRGVFVVDAEKGELVDGIDKRCRIVRGTKKGHRKKKHVTGRSGVDM